MRFAIVDDDMAFAQVMREKIVKLCEIKGVPYEIEHIEDPDNILNEEVMTQYDVITLDIEMPRMSGLEVAAKLNTMKQAHVTPYIIFVSSKEHLVFEALKSFPFSFVRKSHLEELEICIMRIINIISPFYTIKEGRNSVIIKLNTLIYVEKIDHYVFFVTTKGTYRERTTVNTLLRSFSEHGFIKVHSGALVNVAHIKEMAAGWICMSDNKVIPVSRTYKKMLVEKFKDWMVKL